MGNIVSQNSSNYFFDLESDKNLNINNTKLGDLVRNWIKTYDDGMKYGVDVSKADENYDNLLKKRACCTNQTIMKINLPLLKDNNLVGNFEFGTLNIKVIDEVDDKNCGIKSGIDTKANRLDIDNKPIKYNYLRGEHKVAPPDGCKALYGLEPQEKPRPIYETQMCGHVKKERMLMAKNSSLSQPEQASYSSYGKYYKDNTLNRNAYADCNCANSVFYDVPLTGITVEGTKSDMPGYALAQILDNKCSSNKNMAYIVEPAPAISCFQLQSIQDNKILNSNLNVAQSCSVEEINNATEGVVKSKYAGTGPAPLPALQKSNSDQTETPQTNDQTINIPLNYMVGFSVFIVVMFIFIKFFI